MLGPGAPGLDDVMEIANDGESYRGLLARLIKDAEFRSRSGERIKKNILSLHTGHQWTKALEDVYEKLRGTSSSNCLAQTTDTFADSELNLALMRLYSREPFSIRRLIRECIGTLPFVSRFSITLQLRRIGFGLSLLNLLPSPIDRIVHVTARRIKTTLRHLLPLS